MYSLPSKLSRKFPPLFDTLDQLLSNKEIDSYSISATTLEEVFLSLAEREEQQEIRDADGRAININNIDLIVKNHPGPRHVTFRRHISALLAKRFALARESL
eukprot:1116126_1